MQANGNGAGGFMMQTMGDSAAINAVVGLETLGNGGFGTMLGTYSDGLSIAALARLYTAENIGAALQEGALALLRRKFDAAGTALDDALDLLRRSAGTMEAAEWDFLNGRLNRSRQLHKRFGALLSNPIVRRLTRRK